MKTSNELPPMISNPLPGKEPAGSFEALDVRGQEGLLAPRVAALGKALARASQLQARMQFGFSQTEWQVVRLLADFQPVSIRKLASLAMVDAAQISRAIGVLTRNGLVERGTSARDSRRADLRLSPLGMETAVTLRQLSRQRNERLLDGYSPERITGLFEMLEVLTARAMREEMDIAEGEASRET
ncbi:MarR family transcriptional regulator [Pigmentiphaga sp. H8]|uniref:MarR family winged helix-turn-helix transcriptional regulator n=1 Tax=Pigmentiphaga sp. H8 TaxID=2488560 RepID=UPI000F5B86FF|nr:MarR family transcriptional regulator [Pigmentiphaga sp. H8]AZG11397.1 MarR family transcriptional regulator [Pigmentiphaga sp. H8]